MQTVEKKAGFLTIILLIISCAFFQMSSTSSACHMVPSPVVERLSFFNLKVAEWMVAIAFFFVAVFLWFQIPETSIEILFYFTYEKNSSGPFHSCLFDFLWYPQQTKAYGCDNHSYADQKDQNPPVNFYRLAYHYIIFLCS